MQASQSGRTSSFIGKLTFAAALIVAAVLVAFPTIGTLILSFQDIDMSRGFANTFAGAENYQYLLQSRGFPVSVVHSLLFSGLSALVVLAAGALVGYALRALPVRWLRHALCTALLLPVLTPGVLWAQAFFAIFSPTAEQSLPALALWCGLKYVGLAALLTTAALSHGNRSTTLPLLSAGVVALGLFTLLGLLDYTFLHRLSSNSVMRTSLDMTSYFALIGQARFGLTTAASILALGLRAVLLAAVAFPVGALVRRLFPADLVAAEATTKDRLFSLLASGAIALAVAVALATTSLGTPAWPMLPRAMAMYPVYIALAFGGGIVNTALCFCLARPVATAQPARRRITAALLLLTALGTIPVSMGEYLEFRSLGMTNTYFPVLLSGIGSTMGVWPLVFAARALGVGTDEDWFKRMWRPALALLAANVALRMNDTLPSSIYISNASMLHPLQALIGMWEHKDLASMGDVPVIAISALITLLTMAVPATLLLVVRTVFTEKETVGLALPRK